MPEQRPAPDPAEEERALLSELHGLFSDVPKVLRLIVAAEKYQRRHHALFEDGWMHSGAIVPFVKRALTDPEAPLFFYAPTVGGALHMLLWIREHGEPDAFAELCEVLNPPITGKRKAFSKKAKDEREAHRFREILSQLEALDKATPGLTGAEEIHAAGDDGFTSPIVADALAAVRQSRMRNAFKRLRDREPSFERRRDLDMMAAYLWHRGYMRGGTFGMNGENVAISPYRQTLDAKRIKADEVAAALRRAKRTEQRVRDAKRSGKTRSPR